MQHKLTRPTHVAHFLPKDGDKPADEQQDAQVGCAVKGGGNWAVLHGLHYIIAAQHVHQQ